MSTALPASFGRHLKARELPAFVWSLWRCITWRQIGFALLAGLVVNLLFWIAELQSGMHFVDEVGWYGTRLIAIEVAAVIAWPCLLVADAAVAGGVRAWLAYGLVVVVVALLGSVVVEVIGPLLFTPPAKPMPMPTKPGQYIFKPEEVAQIKRIFGFIIAMTYTGIGVTIYAAARAAERTGTRLRDAERTRARAARQLTEQRLQALQARVEPQFLFDTLAEIQQLYEREGRAAEPTLDALIVFLRAALAQTRDTCTTLASEFELARGYLDVQSRRSLGRLVAAVELPDSLATRRLAPMIVQPLIVLAADTRALGDREGFVRLFARTHLGALKIAVETSQATFCDERAEALLVGLRERLATLYGESARIDFEPLPGGGSRARLELPDADGRDR
jgi:hypothetical protein